MEVFYFCIGKSGKLYYDDKYSGHRSICNGLNLNEDEIVKMMYYKKDSHMHKLFDEFGIQGLRLSVVYETVREPFELKKTHLDSIESFINGIESEAV